MAVVDFILSGACLLLWLNWRSRCFNALERARAATLIATVKRTSPAYGDRWFSPALILAVLSLRAFAYWRIGLAIGWTPKVSLGGLPLALYFRSDIFSRMFLFSVLKFLFVTGSFYFSLLLLAAVNRAETNLNPWLAMVRAQLGVAARLPAWLMLLVPFVTTFLFWFAAGPLLSAYGVQVPTKSLQHLARQAAFFGLSGWIFWPYVIAALLPLHMISSYVYLGNSPFWNFVNMTAGRLLRPLAWIPLRVGKFDFAPIAMLLLLAAVVVFLPGRLLVLYQKLSL